MPRERKYHLSKDRKRPARYDKLEGPRPGDNLPSPEDVSANLRRGISRETFNEAAAHAGFYYAPMHHLPGDEGLTIMYWHSLHDWLAARGHVAPRMLKRYHAK